MAQNEKNRQSAQLGGIAGTAAQLYTMDKYIDSQSKNPGQRGIIGGMIDSGRGMVDWASKKLNPTAPMGFGGSNMNYDERLAGDSGIDYISPRGVVSPMMELPQSPVNQKILSTPMEAEGGYDWLTDLMGGW
jgi:hypothetical protein